MDNPELSIVLPVFDRERYIGETLKSLINQTYRDFELIIVDDASTDASLQIARSFDDPRIRIITNDRNRGIAFSRNRGLQEASGRFVAPFDSDDIALPDKFRKQTDFLKQYPEFGMVGSWARMIDENGRLLRRNWKLNAKPERIPAIMLFRNYFVQSSVVIRSEAIPAGGYVENFDLGEDYRMWIEIAEKYKTYNLPEYLILYRLHTQNIMKSDAWKVMKYDQQIFQYLFRRLEIKTDDQVFSALFNIKNSEMIRDMNQLSEIEKLLMMILQQNAKLKLYDQRQLSKEVFNRWMKCCYKSRTHFWASINKFLSSPLTVDLYKSL